MTQYLYPQNLKATANLWLWGLRDFCILGVAALLSIVVLLCGTLSAHSNTLNGQTEFAAKLRKTDGGAI